MRLLFFVLSFILVFGAISSAKGADPEINNVTVVSDDNKQAFIYGLLDYKKTSLSEIENDQKPTLCPETTDLSIEEIDDCIDITIQELLAASEKVNKGPEKEKKNRHGVQTALRDY